MRRSVRALQRLNALPLTGRHWPLASDVDQWQRQCEVTKPTSYVLVGISDMRAQRTASSLVTRGREFEGAVVVRGEP